MRKVLWLLSLLIISSCSSEDETEELLPSSQVKYLKSIDYIDSNLEHLKELFYYEDGFLTKYQNGDENNFFYSITEYTYNSKGKLTKETSLLEGKVIANYSYNAQDKLEKIEFPEGGDVIFSYNGNKVIIENSSQSYKSELTLDNKGRVIKFKAIEFSGDLYVNQECEYDERGNLIKLISKDYSSGNYDDIVKEYVYDDKPNPYYHAYQKLYDSTLYNEFTSGVTNFFFKGYCPNNIINYEEGVIRFEYEYGENGFPVKRIRDNEPDINITYY
ncbi:hypothetical protein [Tenacibaculum jejuense]|uniref:Probable lipoprotein n=1 Tax=Tenacibaculum jejuense TaxID=584609 RepID=A0A238U9Z5_9FLAO|nr:hypothetical protein [Tenacibaculum jejuense]SNR15284.1 Probable lipoprotein precursor [Tenacibaculum jejuense]